MEFPGPISILPGRPGATRRSRTVPKVQQGSPYELCCGSWIARVKSNKFRVQALACGFLEQPKGGTLNSVVTRRHSVSSTVDTFRHTPARLVIFTGVFDNRGHGMRIVHERATSQRVRVALIQRPRPLECRSRYFPDSPLAPPNTEFDISIRHLNRP